MLHKHIKNNINIKDPQAVTGEEQSPKLFNLCLTFTLVYKEFDTWRCFNADILGKNLWRGSNNA